MAPTSSPRIILFGATGYTGRRTAEALVERGARPILAGRDQGRLDDLASALPGPAETAVADVERPDSVRRLVAEGDVLITTVGPFARWGAPAVEAAVNARAVYLDSTGEPTFIRRVFQRYGPQAEASGAALLTAFGFDYVPGNLAASLALRKAGPAASRVDVGYFLHGSSAGSASAGTRASMLGMVFEPMYGFREGRVMPERGRTRSFEVGGTRRHALAVGASEHFVLPRRHPGLREVNVYMGWVSGPLMRMAGPAAKAAPFVAALPGARRALRLVADRVERTSSRGPSGPSEVTSQVVAEAYGQGGERLATAELVGGDPYDVTARLLAWGAITAAGEGVDGRGALGPADAFGLDRLTAGAVEAGYSVT
ncbi:saccharopine dehydrogenase family protein [Bailinhaonella thermotolerans]|uniref:Saccharopine dehydrogenase n=1 Tax=Bailinhaonella thermotolerans TaxID=1070861 RepID=A0A3A4A6L3_9ACTN|nr:NAD(P)H-binding protein [Bailinhaonella thermotolerans]RJL22582.1 saccharopine dehydrogenase [Bailinhaonella thermotolerans]